ncbi:hypothetical protein QL285_039731 [Trifolium repens]|nr:hypothetical protein QL285_039731 [Trifolium repens]
MPGEEHEYLSANSVDRSEIHDEQIVGLFTPEFLASLHTSGLPNHCIKLKAKIEIPIDFKAAWFKELDYHNFALLTHPNGCNVFLGLEVSKTKSFITGGKEAALLYDFKEPTEVTVAIELEGEENDILFEFKDYPNFIEDEEMFIKDTPDFTLHPFDKDDVFGWEKTIKTERTQVAVSFKFYIHVIKYKMCYST